jgi:protein SCO1/2
VTAIDRSAPEADVAATIDELARSPRRRDELVALLAERAALYDGRTSAEVTRLRGWLLAAFARTGLPATALPSALEALESGHAPYEVAAAAIAIRGIEGPPQRAVPYLVRALHNLRGADATVSFECYDPRWPFAQPTTAVSEVLRTLAGLGAHAAGAVGELERLELQPEYPAPARAQLRATLDVLRAAQSSCRADEHRCCGERPLEPRDAPDADGARVQDIALEDQDGRVERFGEYFCGKPSVVAFFYTRCDNPYKCSLTVTKLASLQDMIGRRGLTSALRVAAITYDPDFDGPSRLKRYGADRGLAFDDDVRCFRAITGFATLKRRLGLHVNYGPATVNRHQIEAYLLDGHADVAAAFTGLQWAPDELLEAAERLLAGERRVSRERSATPRCARRSPTAAA